MQWVSNPANRRFIRLLGGAIVLFGFAPAPATRVSAYADKVEQGEKFAAATAPIDEDVDGLFVFDRLTGELQCVVVCRSSRVFRRAANEFLPAVAEVAKTSVAVQVASELLASSATGKLSPAACLSPAFVIRRRAPTWGSMRRVPRVRCF